jgi:hypothetical protein
MAAAPVSAPISWDEPENSIMMPEPTLYAYDEPVPTLYEYSEEPVPTLYAYGENEDWEVSPMEDYMRGPMPEPELIDYEMPPMDMDWENYENYDIMPIMEDYMPEDMNWDELSDPNFYYDQAEEWGYDSIIAESGLPIDFNSTTDVISWDQEQMREDFRDYFGWAIMGDVWDSREASSCADRCSEESGMCCVAVSMQNMQSQAWSYESYCMYQDSIMADYDMEMMGYKLEMVCDKESGPSPTIMESAEEMWGGWMGSSAVRVASGIISAAAIISSIC